MWFTITKAPFVVRELQIPHWNILISGSATGWPKYDRMNTHTHTQKTHPQLKRHFTLAVGMGKVAALTDHTLKIPACERLPLPFRAWKTTLSHRHTIQETHARRLKKVSATVWCAVTRVSYIYTRMSIIALCACKWHQERCAKHTYEMSPSVKIDFEFSL